jgi:DNA-binding NtrC family response regulator
MKIRVLFVEDDACLRDVLVDVAEMNGYTAEGVASAEAALGRLAAEPFDLLVTDITLPGMSGLELLPLCRQLRPDIRMITLTGHGTIDAAVEAMKRGATDFLTKPVNLDMLLSTIRVAAERGFQLSTAPAGIASHAEGITAESPVMRRLLEQVSTVAHFNTTVLLTGETGTGKGLIARSLHRQSPRRDAPFVAFNCASVPEQLLDDELFGHVRGAFTGAQEARKGRFELAEGGTLFLDEIGDMSLPLQSKLLRVLQEREFERLGSSRTLKVDVRIIAATSADLERRIEEGSFRPDLYYRLNVVHLRVPSLRERGPDIRPLAEELLTRFCTNAGLPAKTIDEGVWHALTSYRWPGNVRQLQNAMERGAALTGLATRIHLEDLPEEVREGAAYGAPPAAVANERVASEQASLEGQPIPKEGLSFDEVVSEVERKLLLQSLSMTKGNKVRAAQLLHMKRTRFSDKLKQLRISDEEYA